MKTWTTETWVAGAPEQVPELLTEPDTIARWAPIPFEVLDLDGERLVAGSRARVSGALGPRLEFEVEIREAHEERLSLVALVLTPSSSGNMSFPTQTASALARVRGVEVVSAVPAPATSARSRGRNSIRRATAG
jgi:hypothetical protein